MGRKPIGKVLTLRPIRVDEDVWAALRVLMDKYKTLNEGLRFVLLTDDDPPLVTAAVVEEVKSEPVVIPVVTERRTPTPRERYSRSIRPKGDKTR